MLYFIPHINVAAVALGDKPLWLNGWAEDQPDSADHKCAIVSATDKLWYDVDCDVTRPYFCQYGTSRRRLNTFFL